MDIDREKVLLVVTKNLGMASVLGIDLNSAEERLAEEITQMLLTYRPNFINI